MITIVADQTPVPPDDTLLQNCQETWKGPASFNTNGNASVSLKDINGTLTQTFNFFGNPAGPSTPVEILSGEGRAGDALLTSGFFCDAGGPAGQIDLPNGPSFVGELVPFPSASAPTRLCTRSVPFDAFFGAVKFHRACVPVEPNGLVTFALTSDPDNPFARINFGDLPRCSGSRALGRQAVPNMSELGLIALALGLLAGGTRVLSRRRGFASLPTP